MLGRGRYKLIGKLPVPCGDLIEWALWLETADRQVALTVIGPLEVSTVFLSLDHNFGQGDPLLFETAIFGEPEGTAIIERYHTWGEAEAGHARAVADAQERVAKAGAAVVIPEIPTGET